MFLQMNAGPMMNYFKGYVEGTNEPGDFASWTMDGYGDAPLKDARSIGSERILGMFKAAPAWPAIAHQEAKLIEFIDGVLAWQPPIEDDEDEPTDAQEAGVDLTNA
jgi:hypothetical protein